MKNIHDLDEDILPQILQHCDVYTVLSFSRLSKYFRSIFASHTTKIWRRLVLNLAFHSVGSSHTYTSEECIACLKRLVHGPVSWLSKDGPVVAHQMTLANCPAATLYGEIRLLPGGRYFAIRHDSGIGCYDLETRGACVWSRPTRVVNYAVEIGDQGRKAVFFLCLCTNSPNPTLVVVRVNLETGLSEESELLYKPLELHLGFCHNPAVGGDFVGLSLRFASTKCSAIIVVDWRRQRFVLFYGSSAWSRSGVAFIPGYILLNLPALDPPHEQLLRIYSIASLAPKWRPLSDIGPSNHPTLPLDSSVLRLHSDDEIVKPIRVYALKYKNSVFQNVDRVQMEVYPNPLRDGAYRILIYVSRVTRPASSVLHRFSAGVGLFQRTATGAMLFAFRLVVDRQTGDLVELTKVSATPSIRDLMSPQASYTGYAVDRDPLDGDTLLDLRMRGNAKRLQKVYEPNGAVPLAANQSRSVHLSETGAVAVLQSPHIHISYYV
ncbi:hypothetical protein MKEN_01141500 [Mycena kentingensis (nom. inval.)]|nr:hypothetical protein MKEN_01141500 [Mycena kentingensis (nom. inval.)]